MKSTRRGPRPSPSPSRACSQRAGRLRPRRATTAEQRRDGHDQRRALIARQHAPRPIDAFNDPGRGSSRRPTRTSTSKPDEYEWTARRSRPSSPAARCRPCSRCRSPTPGARSKRPARRHHRAGRGAAVLREVQPEPCSPQGTTRRQDLSALPNAAYGVGAALQPDAVRAGRARPGQAADHVGRGAAVRQADRRDDRPGRLRADEPGRQHRRLDADHADLRPRRPDAEPATATSARRRSTTRSTGSALRLLQDMRWTDNSMGANFVFDWGDINQAFAAGKIGMYMSGSDVYNEPRRRATSTRASTA